MTLHSSNNVSHFVSPRSPETINHLLRPLRSLLDDASITELAINQPLECWAMQDGVWQRHHIPALTMDLLRALVTALVTYNGLQSSSCVSAILPGGERAEIAMPPAVIDGMIAMTIRKHLPVVKSLEELERHGTFDDWTDVNGHRDGRQVAPREEISEQDQALLQLKTKGKLREFLQACVLARRNIVIAGKTGCGKTTLARSLIHTVPLSERVVTLEDVHELALPDHPNRLHLLYGDGEGRISAAQALRRCMRLSPDRIFLAELRGNEAWEYLGALNNGHPGSITTTHANSAQQAYSRIATLIKSSATGQQIDMDLIRAELFATIDVVLFMQYRRVSEVFYDPALAQASRSGTAHA